MHINYQLLSLSFFLMFVMYVMHFNFSHLDVIDSVQFTIHGDAVNVLLFSNGPQVNDTSVLP